MTTCCPATGEEEDVAQDTEDNAVDTETGIRDDVVPCIF
jgi:hypothetical protein